MLVSIGAVYIALYVCCVTQASVGHSGGSRGCVSSLTGPQLARLRRRRTEAAHWWPLSPASGQRAQSAIGWGQLQTANTIIIQVHSQTLT